MNSVNNILPYVNVIPSMKHSAMTRLQMKALKKADYEHFLINLSKAEVGDNIDVIIQPTYLNCDIHALVIGPKSHLQ